MSEFKIDKKIPIPMKRTAENKYPLRTLAVGDSFFVPEKDAVRARASAYQFAKRNPEYLFTSRLDGDGVRIWRIAAK